MTLKRKLVAALLCLCAALALAPAAAFAEDVDYIIYVGGEQLAGNADQPVYVVTTDDGELDYDAEANESNYNIKWNGSTLTLRDAKVTQGSYEYWGIHAAVWCGTGFDVKLVGDNAVEGPNLDATSSDTNQTSAGIYAGGPLAISGEGTLRAVGGAVEVEGQACSYGITTANGGLTVSGASVEAEGGEASATSTEAYSIARSCGINTDYGTFKMTSGTVKAHGGDTTGVFSSSFGISADGVAIDSGTVDATSAEAHSTGDEEFGYACSVGIDSNGADGSLAITGGTVTATSNVAWGGAYSYGYGLGSNGDTSIENATVVAQGGEAVYSAGIFAINGESIAIKDSTVKATGGRASASSAGIWADGGNLTIDGGKVDAAVGMSEGNAAYGIYAYYGDIAINGSTVNATGMKEYVDGVAPNYSSGIYSEAGNVTITGDGAVVNANGGFARQGAVGIAADGGDIVIKGGAVQTDGTWRAIESSEFGYGLGAVKYEDGTGGNIVISGGSVAAAGYTSSLTYEGELVARPADGTIAMSVLGDLVVDQETYELNWAAMTENAFEIEGSPFAEETVIESGLTEGKCYFRTVGTASDPIEPEDPVDPADPEDLTGSNKQAGDTNKGSTLSQTGDDANLTIWLVLLLASAASMAVVAVCGYRKSSKR